MADLHARAQLLLVVADDLDARAYPFAGVVRDVARAVLERDRPAEDQAADLRCSSCGREVIQLRTGRPRKLCTDCSPRKTRKSLLLERP
jgi:hypothetical protein